ncbi:hypothetical protein V6x_01030 [Gimesia chilikensis]|uniref:Uncharacterized protein n=1 Tax=Gimesia chilikensis TaxID=2605989 RepID=A0A517W598_9PLAN|nr:hypothetical protein [Gimesia chilikensis]QDU00430.1 hypothetical protein V6x_01030 [Gimesia chilikensis]
MHKLTYKIAGLVAVAGIMTVLSAQGLHAGEPGSLKLNQKQAAPIQQVGHLNDKCGCKHNHVYSYSNGATYSGGGDCPHCRTSAGIGKRGSLREFFRCKFGYFIPTGCGGKGCAPIGHYKMTYAVDPYYFDGRDGQLYGAQGYGVPVAVPLAPTVRQTYNYGWGVPSSRITPISRIVQ